MKHIAMGDEKSREYDKNAMFVNLRFTIKCINVICKMD